MGKGKRIFMKISQVKVNCVWILTSDLGALLFGIRWVDNAHVLKNSGCFFASLTAYKNASRPT